MRAESAITGVAALAVVALFGIFVGLIVDAVRSGQGEVTMPANFEAQGAFTLGCSLWLEPDVKPFGPDNPDDGYVGLVLYPGGGRLHLSAVIDGPNGTTTIIGDRCGISIDWSAFPEIVRAP